MQDTKLFLYEIKTWKHTKITKKKHCSIQFAIDQQMDLLFLQ
jgi:hypothetical protein